MSPCTKVTKLQFHFEYNCTLPPIFGEKDLRKPLKFVISDNMNSDSVDISFELHQSCGTQKASVISVNKEVKTKFEYEVILDIFLDYS